jgi:hypothetical protein
MSIERAPARATLLLALPLLAACATGGSNPYTAPSGKAPITEVEVRNERWEDLTVYLTLGGSTFVRLGQVTGKTTGVLRIPDNHTHRSDWMRLVASHADHEPHTTSAEFQIMRGERAFWIIPLYPGPTPVTY